MSRLTRDGVAEPVLRDQILRRERRQGNIHFPSLAKREQDWQSYPVDPYSAIICDDHTYNNHLLRCLHCFHIVGVNYRQPELANTPYLLCTDVCSPRDCAIPTVLFG